MAKRRLARTAVLTAAALLLPVGGVPAASATDPAAGPTAFTGTVYLPDGETVAKAAVVDLSLAGAKPFARGVSGLDGAFSVDVPETDELVALALAAGSSISIRWTASDLYPQASVPPPTVSTQAVLGTVQTSPGFGQVAGEVVAYLIDTTTNALANALSDPTMVEFHLPYVAGTGSLVTKVADLAAAAGIYNDPDLVAGNEDLDDPDVIPPLLAELSTYDVTDADSVCGTDDLGLLACPPVAQDGSGDCKIAETWLVPARGAVQMRGTASTATLRLRHCTDDDGTQDYWVWEWKDPKVTNLDTNEEYVFIWRYKQRTQLASSRKVNGQPAPYDFSKYFWDDTDPDDDQYGDDDWQLHWQVGFGGGSAGGAVSGDYTVRKAKKIHPWDDSATNEHRLFHVSWISNSRVGSRGEWFRSGGGMSFVVPQAEPKHRLRTAMNTINIWRCWVPKDPPMEYSCDARD